MDFTQTSFKELRNLVSTNECFLVNDSWDDFGYKTSFRLVYFTEDAQRVDLGAVKIIQKGMDKGRVEIKPKFRKLGKAFASLGQDEGFYESLRQLDERVRTSILVSMRDIIWDANILAAFSTESSFRNSLTRSVGLESIQKFSDILFDRAETTAFHFSYKFDDGFDEKSMEFIVRPRVLPPSNIHAIIGRNGVGKTRLLSSISAFLRDGFQISEQGSSIRFHKIRATNKAEMSEFAGLINVAFSAFDEHDLPVASKRTKSGINFSYIGLRKTPLASEKEPQTSLKRMKSTADLKREFVDSALICLRSSRKSRWRDTMAILESDPLFADMGLQGIANSAQKDYEQEISDIFEVASSGHKIVLLTLTRLVELVEERTLVLIDEPEAHLHPPLQSAFTRALSALLAERNGVAILATHSPVILQEVSQDCVWMLYRSGANVSFERPQVETFAENIGVLTREVFRFEVGNSGFHNLLREEISKCSSLEQVIDKFRNHVGAEGRAIARSMWREKTHD